MERPIVEIFAQFGPNMQAWDLALASNHNVLALNKLLAVKQYSSAHFLRHTSEPQLAGMPTCSSVPDQGPSWPAWLPHRIERGFRICLLVFAPATPPRITPARPSTAQTSIFSHVL